MSNVAIRKMEVADVQQVMEVEKASFTNSWTTDIFYQEITDNPHAYYFVMELDDTIVGYVGMWIVLDDVQITNIAIMPSFRGRRLGEKLFHYTIRYAIMKGVSRLSLEVRKSNMIAQKLYRKFGLVSGGIRKNYYTDNQEDAIVMWVNLT
ncbi:ribosomal protein S18-alanine N-acetyltransferase [Agaribacter marinus]|uniref:[Ribosomal protein bS18]-alanine N-acetyltransferase n=1 Tax=Virgibacillus salarius TaxID=447199 RepID=A0A941DZJ6_9BACI|nr:ribosomal protein S18-alanine N-acetyltransferase [Virgibacillus salarius]MBR7798221.1 ribosomal protein S18-alanine N-acetyltransferase [Virgibacillus salarius]NAZ10929.1 ribosomal protein S18-alanine N-acetyltransferase [Agaribacter marinus]